MITIFSIPKPFRGHINIIQRNAIKSWTLLRPTPEIILFGDEEGTREMAKELGVHHIPDVARNEYGTPLVSDLFNKAERFSKYDILCYVNADIILMSDFMKGVQSVIHWKRRFFWRRRFLMVGQRWDVDITEILDFQKKGWEEELKEYARRHGKLHPPTGIDYFVFSRGLWKSIPPFAIGRPAWDNWMIYRARARNAAVIDATNVVMAIHQNHDYSHVSATKDEVWKGPEARRNLAMAGGYHHVFTLEDATHILTERGPKLDLRHHRLNRHVDKLSAIYPRIRHIIRAFFLLTRISKILRMKLW